VQIIKDLRCVKRKNPVDKNALKKGIKKLDPRFKRDRLIVLK